MASRLNHLPARLKLVSVCVWGVCNNSKGCLNASQAKFYLCIIIHINITDEMCGGIDRIYILTLKVVQRTGAGHIMSKKHLSFIAYFTTFIKYL